MEDRGKLTPVLRGALERKLHCLLNSGDLVGYRVLLNMQAVHLRNLPQGLIGKCYLILCALNPLVNL